MKLISAAQANLPVHLDSIKCELPLVCFYSILSDKNVKYGIPPQIDTQILMHSAMEKGLQHCPSEAENKSDAKTSVTSPKKSPSISSPKYGHEKPENSPDHHIAAAAAAYETRQPALLQQDGQLSLNYGNQPAPLQSSLSQQSFSVETKSHSNSDSYSEDPWRITEEQREYYTNQFKTLQPDLNSFISGSVAKTFFTKSKLPIHELSHIWDLSDVDCDGALILAEFCAAFHLIVARKNGYDLPDTLPKTLLSEILLQSASLKPNTDGVYETFCGTNSCLARKELETVCEDPANSEPLILFDVETSNAEPKTTVEVQPSQKPLKGDSVNDPTAHKELYTHKTRPRSRSYSSTSVKETMKKVEEPPTPPPRPQKTHSRASSLDLNRIIQHQSPALRAGWIPPPPALPPRPCLSQSERVSEVELHSQTNKSLPSTEENSPAKKEILHNQPPAKPLRRKFQPESQVLENHDLSSASSVTSSAASLKSYPAAQKQPSKQKKDIQTAIRKNKEANAVLARLNSELQQQLKEVHQERIALETQLEQHRPLTVL